MVSIYLAKLYPYLKIYSYEPVKLNYENLLSNIKENNIPQQIITAKRFAVSNNNNPVTIATALGNTGASKTLTNHFGDSRFVQKPEDINIPAITLPEIFENNKIDKVKLLKIDCEGAEYNILNNCPIKYLKRIENLRGEFHYNDSDIEGEEKENNLIEHCKKYIPNVIVTSCNN